MEEDLLSLADKRLAHWGRRMGLWYTMYYAFGSLAVLLTITVASHPPFIPDKDWLPSLAWLAAIFQGLTTFLFALPKATAYRGAWRTLWRARLDFIESEQSDESKKQLKQAIDKGWEIIDGSYEDALRASRPTSASTRTSRKRGAG